MKILGLKDLINIDGVKKLKNINFAKELMRLCIVVAAKVEEMKF